MSELRVGIGVDAHGGVDEPPIARVREQIARILEGPALGDGDANPAG